MMIKKIAKHKLIFQKRLQQKNTLQSISKIENNTLQLVLKAFKLAKNNSFSKEDIAAFKRCEAYRDTLINNDSIINYEIFGLDNTATVSEICHKAASKKKWCHFLYNIAKELTTANVLEIGTNLGISGTYLLEAIKDKTSFFTTMEGLPQLCEIASKQFETIITPDNFKVVQGLYDITFPEVMKNERKYNLIFIDGNHKKEPTLQYFNAIKLNIKSPAIFVFDDIYWSDAMKDAWSIIRNDPSVNFTIDLYEQGIVIIDTNENTKNKYFSLHLSY